MKKRKLFTISTIVLVLALALVAGVQAAGGLYAETVFISENVPNPGEALGMPDESYAEVSSEGGALILDMGQQTCGPLYVYAPADTVGGIFVHACEPEVELCDSTGGGYFYRDNETASTYDAANRRWIMNLYDVSGDLPGEPAYEGIIRTVVFYGSGISVDAVEASPCGSQPEFGGFLPPIAGDALNAAKAGRAVPVNFSLGGDFGLDILESTSVEIACEGAPVSGDVVPTVSAGASGLTYDPLTDQYTYVWKTEKSWSGTCRQLILTIESNTYDAEFKFK